MECTTVRRKESLIVALKLGIKKSSVNSEDSVSSENRMVLIVRHRCFQLFFQGDVHPGEAYGHRDDFSLRLPGVF